MNVPGLHRACVILGLLTVFGAPPAFGAAIILSDRDLARSSVAAVDARVLSLTPHWNEDHSIIFTTVTLGVLQPLMSRDFAVGRTMKIEVPGGEIGDVGMLFSEAAIFHPDERVVVFARRWTGDRLVVAGGHQGRLSVDKNGVLLGRGIPVDTFGARVRSLAR